MDAKLFKKLLKDLSDGGLLKVSNGRGLVTVTAETTVFIGLGIALARAEIWGFLFWLIEVALGLSLFRWFVILHECGHKTLFTRIWMNSVVGHLASVFCLVPYFPWRNIHLLHHRWVGVIDKDPTQKDLLKLLKTGNTQTQLFRIVWYLWLPIPFAKFIFETFWGYPLARARNGDWDKALLGCVSLAICVGVHAILITTVGPRDWAIYFLPMLVVFYFMIENMNLPQHSELFPYLSDTHPNPIPLAQQDAITRSTHLPNWLSVGLALNFNRHTEHHLFPAAPWYSLNTVRERIRCEGYRHPHEVRFLRFMWKLRRRDPLTIYRDALPHPTDIL